MNTLTGFSVITQSVGKVVTYAYSIIDTEGNITKSNVQITYVEMDVEELDLITQLEAKINARLNPPVATV